MKIENAIEVKDVSMCFNLSREKVDSIKEYIIQQKMKHAQVMLRTTTLPVNFIAAKVGYPNFSHFSFTYKKELGVTPQEERKRANDKMQ